MSLDRHLIFKQENAPDSCCCARSMAALASSAAVARRAGSKSPPPPPLLLLPLLLALPAVSKTSSVMAASSTLRFSACVYICVGWLVIWYGTGLDKPPNHQQSTTNHNRLLALVLPTTNAHTRTQKLTSASPSGASSFRAKPSASAALPCTHT